MILMQIESIKENLGKNGKIYDVLFPDLGVKDGFNMVKNWR